MSAVRDDLVRRHDVRSTVLALGDREVAIAHPADADALISETDYVRDERLPYWADVWPSARVLAERVIREPGDERRLLELGCGVGLVSTAAACAGFDVTATDYYADACAFARLNAWDNAQCDITTSLLDWRHLPEHLGRWDLVVASDVLYEPAYAELVAEVLWRTIDDGGSAVVADPGRLALGSFVRACERRALVVGDAEFVAWAEGAQQQVIQLHVVRHRAVVTSDAATTVLAR